MLIHKEPYRRRPAATTLRLRPVVSKRSWLFQQVKINAYIPETLGLIGVMAMLNMGFMPGHPGFLGIRPNPLWIVILLVTGRYGFRAGLLSSVTAAATYMGLISTRVAEQVISWRDLFSWEYAGPAVLFIAGGTVLGMIVQRHLDQRARLKQENELLIQDNETIKRGEEELRDLNTELANRVVGATDTLPVLYRFAKKLNVPDINEIYVALTELVVEVIRARQVSVYEVELGEGLQLHSRNGRRTDGPGLHLPPALATLLFGKRQVLTLHDLAEMQIQRQDLILCGPLTAGSEGKVLGLLVVEQMDFIRYNPATLRLFSVIVDWASTSLEKAAQYREFPEELKMARARTSVARSQRARLQMLPTTEMPPIPVEALESDPWSSMTPTPTPMEALQVQQPGAPDQGKSWTDWFAVRDPQGSTPKRAAGSAAALAALESVDGASEADFAVLGAIMDDVDHGEMDTEQVGLIIDRATGEPDRVGRDPRGRVAAMQHMLRGELEDADTHGRPLALLLAEINQYVKDREESSRPKLPPLGLGTSGKRRSE